MGSERDFRNLREGWANEGKKKPHLNIGFDVGLSQYSQNKLIHIFEILFIISAKILINQKFNCQVWIVDFQAQKLKIEIV